MYTFLSTLVALVLSILSINATTPEEVVSSYSLTVSTSLPFPTATLSPSQADDHIISTWTLNRNRIQGEPSHLAFVPDPFPSSGPSGPVLQVTYPAGTFGDNPGGVQFYSLFNGSIKPQTMLLSYQVAFPAEFDFVKGGKLPGLRGGPIVNGCEGGTKPNGTDCFSTRLMWRTNGRGEVYAYITTPKGFDSQSNVTLNSDFGTSIGRGLFSYSVGAWNDIMLLVQLNNPGNTINGNVLLYHNGVLVIQQSQVQFRITGDILAGGLFFSTFYGGDDASWAPTTDQQTFFRNFRLWASNVPSTSAGVSLSPAAASSTEPKRSRLWIVGMCAVTAVFIYGMYII